VVGKTTWGLNAAFRDEHHMTPFTESKVLLTINLSGYSGHETIIPLKSGICTCLMKETASSWAIFYVLRLVISNRVSLGRSSSVRHDARENFEN